VDEASFRQLAEWIAMPSVSADPAHAADVRSAGEWLCERLRDAGGDAEILDWNGSPLAVGEVRASTGADDAPTLLCYGHFDVQPPDPLEQWESPPFELTHRGEWLYGRGVADDKGQLFLLATAAGELARAGALPVNLRFACDGEEETGGQSIVEFLEADERGADAALIFDSDMVARGRPSFNVATRGLTYYHLTVRAGARDLHSGIYGGSALNAMHALTQILAAVEPRDGRLPEPLEEGVAPPTEAELAAWRELPPGEHELSSQGARPADARAAEEFYVRTWARPALDVNGIAGGSPHMQKTVLPVEAVANVSIRLAPGQEPRRIAEAFERLVHEAAPPGAEVEVDLWAFSEPGLVRTDAPALRLAGDAFERTVGARPLLIRSGGTLPIVPALSKRGIPVVVTGFALPDSNIHSPNERLLAEYAHTGIEAAKAVFTELGSLPRG
jgi:acetylornithine deacetylase/succinyl-diaminopimelate desuccinylase-like protein